MIRIAKLEKLIGTIQEIKFSINYHFEGFTAFYFQALIFEIASNPQLVFKVQICSTFAY